MGCLSRRPLLRWKGCQALNTGLRAFHILLHTAAADTNGADDLTIALKGNAAAKDNDAAAVCIVNTEKGLARLAQNEYGFELPEKVTQNCELCYLTRCFLRQHHPEVFGPQEVYD